VPTNKQRREAERRHLERQLQNRRVREARRRKQTLIISIVMTIVLIAGIVVTVVVLSSGNDKKPAAGKTKKPTPVSTSPVASACPTGSAPQKVAKGTGKLVSFDGVTVRGATDLSKPPTVGSTGTKSPTRLAVKDLVVGKGKVAKPTDTVQVKYDGVLYCDGTEFDGPAEHGDKAVGFSLQRVVPGFTEGIGGTKGVAGMKVGGRRIIIMPSALGYGKTGSPPTIPANSPLVFIVDLKAVS
jgi:hypothetical protein